MVPDYRRRMITTDGMTTTAWSISNFKSIEHARVSLQPGQVTVLTGTNSIGKSSLLQSMLMLCQSMSNYGDDLVLNGALARLGVPEEVVRDGCNTCQLGIEYSVRNRRRGERRLDFSCELSLCASKPEERMGDLSTLALSSLRIQLVHSDEIELNLSNIDPTDAETCKSELAKRAKMKMSDVSILKMVDSDNEGPSRTFVAFHGLQPTAIIKLRTEDQAYADYHREIKNYIAAGLRFTGSGSNEMRYLVALRKELMPESINGDRVPTAIAARRDINRISGKIDDLSTDELDAVISRVASNLAEKDRHVIRGILGRGYLYEIDFDEEDPFSTDALGFLTIALGGLTDALVNVAMRVGYIGPLRDDPRVISPLTEEMGNNLPLGIKGERAAAVLLSQYDTVGRYGFPNERKLRKATLGEAVDAWAQYLGVAKTVHASNKQKLGVSINIISGATERDLTQVGVGASQAIPILVGVLQADHGSIIVIEQPELHLHPSAQAKLADFLLFARPDITVLVESHSEALVTRLRRRVVENEALAKRINIQFFEKDGEAGGVVGHNLDIDVYGNLNAWPEGFMDAVQEDSRVIMKAAIAKRKEKRGQNGR